MRDPPPRRLAVILHADVSASTALVQSDERRAHRLIGEAFERLSDKIAGYGGVVHELRGDAMVAGFDRVTDALCAALAFQAGAPEDGDQRRAVLRIGVSLGEDVMDARMVTGPGVVLAQRVEALAEPGGVAVTAAVRDVAPERYPFEYQSLGRRELKGFREPVLVHRVTLRSGTRVPPPEPHATDPPLPTRAGSRRWLVGGAIGGGLVVAFAVGVWTPWGGGDRARGIDAADLVFRERPSIAVLPFENLSGDPQQEYFSDGITNDLITDLSRFSDLLVIASNSVFAYKGKAVKVADVGRDLGVRYALEGTVQRGHERLRVNAQLIDATTDEHLWAQRYDTPLDDLLDLQDRLAAEIVSRLAVRVTEIERGRSLEKGPETLEAYDLVLRARALLWSLERAGNFEARPLLRRAIELEPSYAPAYTSLGWTYLNPMLYGWTDSPVAAREEAARLGRHALTLDRNNVDAHVLLGRVHLNRREHEAALVELERAIALNPNDAEARAQQGVALVYSGRPEGAIRALEGALRVDPNMNPEGLMHLGIAYYLVGRFEEAVTALERSASRNPDNVFIRLPLVAAYIRLERLGDARREVAAVMKLDPFFELEEYGRIFRVPDDARSFVTALRAAGL